MRSEFEVRLVIEAIKRLREKNMRNTGLFRFRNWYLGCISVLEWVLGDKDELPSDLEVELAKIKSELKRQIER